MYILTQDDDGHWFVIPTDREEEWSDYLGKVYSGEDAEQPDWVDEVGGSYTMVKFSDYEIE